MAAAGAEVVMLQGRDYGPEYRASGVPGVARRCLTPRRCASTIRPSSGPAAGPRHRVRTMRSEC
eukprot:2543231-Alexandrium_andersonii.AAC.1